MKIPTPVEHRVLALLDEERSGVDVLGLYESSTGEELSRHTMYAALRRMGEEGWVAASEPVGRERGFSLTRAGHRVLDASRSFYSDLAEFGR